MGVGVLVAWVTGGAKVGGCSFSSGDRLATGSTAEVVGAPVTAAGDADDASPVFGVVFWDFRADF